MKQLLFSFIVFLWFSICLTSKVNAQGVGINSSGNPPDPSAILDASSTTKGALIPRMTTVQRDSIASPAEGLQIFNTTTKCSEMYVYGFWQNVWCATCPLPSAVTASASPNPICAGSTLALSGGATGATGWSWAGPNGFNSTLQSPAITSITTGGAGVYSLTASNACGAATAVNTASVTVNDVPSSPTSGTHVPSGTQITWNWNTASGATGYKWGTTNVYGAATDSGANTSYTQTGLTMCSSYTLYVWAYNACGNSTSLTLNASTGCSQVFTYTGGTQTFTVPTGVTSIIAKAWGGGGGGHNFGSTGPGGGGGFSTATLSVTPGENLTIYVGGGGGHGTDNDSKGAGGGGGSGIKRSSSILLVAGGGSGNSNYGQTTNTGVGGGTSGGDGNGGTGGTQTGPGVHGGSGNIAGSDGNGNNGGNGGTYNSQIGGAGGFGLGNGGAGGSYFGTGNGCGGGGGGGGYFGGGGGNGHNSAGGQSGGGGSGFVSGTNASTVAGSGAAAGNNTDTDYANNAGQGGAIGVDGNPGRVVIKW